jgi:membrane protein DedA with SNARE-associated domain
VLASLLNVSHVGYPLLFLLVLAEAAGIPLPGELGLIAAGILASQGKLQMELVIPVATLGVILGSSLGYLIGRHGGRRLLERPGIFYSRRRQVLDFGEPFFKRHGAKAVFFGRFILVLRIWVSWLAGATRMPWASFLVWTALGGLCWASLVGLLAYSLGHAAGAAITTFGIAAAVVVVLVLVIALVLHRRRQRLARERRLSV